MSTKKLIDYESKTLDETNHTLLHDLTEVELPQSHLRQGVNRALTKLGEEYARIMLIENPKMFGPDVENIANFVKEYNMKGTPYAYFITVNPKPNVDLVGLKHVIQTVKNKKWFTHFVIGYETTDNDNRSPHCHIYLLNPTGKPKSQVQREIYNTVKSIVGNAQAVNVKMIKKQDQKTVIKYVCKDKNYEMYGLFLEKLEKLRSKNKK